MKEDVKRDVAELGLLGVMTILVGEDPAPRSTSASSTPDAFEVGIRSIDKRLPAETTQEEVRALIEELNADDDVDGFLVQTPLPGHLDESALLSAVRPEKDVDGLTPRNAGLLYLGRNAHVGADAARGDAAPERVPRPDRRRARSS